MHFLCRYTGWCVAVQQAAGRREPSCTEAVFVPSSTGHGQVHHGPADLARVVSLSVLFSPTQVYSPTTQSIFHHLCSIVRLKTFL